MKNIITQSAVLAMFAVGSLVALAPLASAQTADVEMNGQIMPDPTHGYGKNGFPAGDTNYTGGANGGTVTVTGTSSGTTGLNDDCGTNGRECPNQIGSGNDDNTSAGASVTANTDVTVVNGEDNQGFFNWIAGWNVWNVFGSGNDNGCGENGKMCPDQIGNGNDGSGNLSDCGKNGRLCPNQIGDGNGSTTASTNDSGGNDNGNVTSGESRGFFQVLVSSFLNLF